MGKKMETKWTILLVGVFAEEYIVDIAEKLCATMAEGNSVTTLIWKKSTSSIMLPSGWKAERGDGQEEDNSKVLPFFICEKIEDIYSNGLKCPDEFAIERKDLFDGEKFKADNLLKQRIEILKALNPDGIDIETFRDWMSGVMRKYLFLDDVAHGTSGFIDAEDPNWDWSSDDKKYKWIERDKNDTDDAKHKYRNHGQWLKDRFAVNSTANNGDSLQYLRPIMQALWDEYFDDGNLSLQVLSNEENITSKIDRLTNVYNKPYENPLPLSHGDRARFVTPTGKIHILLIDDDVKKSLLCTDKEIAKIFSVQPFELTPKDFPNLEKNLREILNNNLSYDFALVDLCFDEDPGQDPLGYHVIKKLAKLFPHMPIVVYSRYKDMGHISRAFQCGAKWFLEKGEEHKLARHMMDLVKKGGWKREWRAMQEYNPVEFVYTGKDPAFDDKFRHTDEWQYLTAKSLEFFPGKFIEVKKMGGGISSASTFRVQKGLKLDGKPLQSPMIIKIDATPNTRMEYERYFRYIRPYMANEAGRIEKPCVIIDRDYSAIVYTFAGRQDKAHALDSMKSMLKGDVEFKSSCDYEKYRKAFDMIFDEILPKIHRVTPNREFGDGDKNRHQEVFSKPAALDAAEAFGAAFPNLQFGEVEEKNFFQTYLIRYPHFRKIKLLNTAFQKDQPTLEEINAINSDENKKYKNKSETLNLHPYEFRGLWNRDDGNIDLEVYDCEKNREPCLLTGPIATHMAKYRRQMYPGSILWVSEDPPSNDDSNSMDDREQMFDNDRVGKERHRRLWVGYAKKYTALNNNCENVTPGKIYFDLVDKVLCFCKALYGAENADYKGYLSDNNPLFDEAEVKRFFEHIRPRFKCPIAICHGDLNYGNIMLESRKHPPKDEKPDVSQTITDAWFIDFAWTRRDMIAHDFNVMFTDTLALLFDTKLFKGGAQGYKKSVVRIFPRFIRDVMFAENPNPPDYLNDDARFVFIYKILRRIRRAALESGISKEMYTLTTVLECLMTLKLHLKSENIRASAALFAVAEMCFDKLCEDVELDLLKMSQKA